MAKLFIVEPRNPDGSLNVKDHECFRKFSASGVTERDLFNYWFAENPADRSSWDKLRAFFKTKGWEIREKTW